MAPHLAFPLGCEVLLPHRPCFSLHICSALLLLWSGSFSLCFQWDVKRSWAPTQALPFSAACVGLDHMDWTCPLWHRFSRHRGGHFPVQKLWHGRQHHQVQWSVEASASIINFASYLLQSSLELENQDDIHFKKQLSITKRSITIYDTIKPSKWLFK